MKKKISFHEDIIEKMIKVFDKNEDVLNKWAVKKVPPNNE